MKDEQKKDSKILFLEKATWKYGAEIITVLLPDENGKKRRVAHIYMIKDPNVTPRTKMFKCTDSKGNEIVEQDANLYKLKKKIIEIEHTLHP